MERLTRYVSPADAHSRYWPALPRVVTLGAQAMPICIRFKGAPLHLPKQCGCMHARGCAFQLQTALDVCSGQYMPRGNPNLAECRKLQEVLHATAPCTGCSHGGCKPYCTAKLHAPCLPCSTHANHAVPWMPKPASSRRARRPHATLHLDAAPESAAGTPAGELEST